MHLYRFLYIGADIDIYLPIYIKTSIFFYCAYPNRHVAEIILYFPSSVPKVGIEAQVNDRISNVDLF